MRSLSTEGSGLPLPNRPAPYRDSHEAQSVVSRPRRSRIESGVQMAVRHVDGRLITGERPRHQRHMSGGAPPGLAVRPRESRRAPRPTARTGHRAEASSTGGTGPARPRPSGAEGIQTGPDISPTLSTRHQPGSPRRSAPDTASPGTGPTSSGITRSRARTTPIRDRTGSGRTTCGGSPPPDPEGDGTGPGRHGRRSGRRSGTGTGPSPATRPVTADDGRNGCRRSRRE